MLKVRRIMCDSNEWKQSVRERIYMMTTWFSGSSMEMRIFVSPPAAVEVGRVDV